LRFFRSLLEEGEMLVIPRGAEHCPKAGKEVQFLLAGVRAAGGNPAWSKS